MSGRRIRALLFVALALPLAGCWKEQQQAFGKCIAASPFQPKRIYAPYQNVQTPMTHCMDAQGYVPAYDNTYCAYVPVPRRSPYCYAPKGFLPKIGFDLEMMMTPGPKPPVTTE
jgi:hypothetical protein